MHPLLTPDVPAPAPLPVTDIAASVTFARRSAGLDVAAAAAHLAQLDRPARQRSLTARAYGSAYRALIAFMQQEGERLPTRRLLERWRDDLLARGLSVTTVNARLAAARKLLRLLADDTTDIQLKLVLRDWANVTSVTAMKVQDKTEADYGLRLTLPELDLLLRSFNVTTLKGLRDRALVAVLAGAGLRLAEACALTWEDVFATDNEAGLRGIRVRRGKHHKARIVVLGGADHWLFRALLAWVEVAAVAPGTPLFRALRGGGAGAWSVTVKPLSPRAAQDVIARLTIRGGQVRLSAHDLRRTYAKLCQQAGMSWDALREQMGHSSIHITEAYVGKAVDWSARVPGWSPDL